MNNKHNYTTPPPNIEAIWQKIAIQTVPENSRKTDAIYPG